MEVKTIYVRHFILVLTLLAAIAMIQQRCYMEGAADALATRDGFAGNWVSVTEQIQKWGGVCNFHSQSSVSFKKNLKFLRSALCCYTYCSSLFVNLPLEILFTPFC